MTIVCKIELGLLKHNISVVGEEGNVLKTTSVFFKDISETVIKMAKKFNAKAIFIDGVPQLKDEIVEEISQLDNRFMII